MPSPEFSSIFPENLIKYTDIGRAIGDIVLHKTIDVAKAVGYRLTHQLGDEPYVPSVEELEQRRGNG